MLRRLPRIAESTASTSWIPLQRSRIQIGWRKSDTRFEEERIRVIGMAAGNVLFVHIMTWRDESIPDNAPPEITSIWDEMHTLGTVSFVVVKLLSH